ncbi:MAG: NADH-quinone oxidoreductase subunit M, partial [Pseudomonadota bacterium]
TRAAIFWLSVVPRAPHGPPADGTPVEDLTPREQLMMGAMMAALLILGLFPQPVIDLARGSLAQIGFWYALGVPE